MRFALIKSGDGLRCIGALQSVERCVGRLQIQPADTSDGRRGPFLLRARERRDMAMRGDQPSVAGERAEPTVATRPVRGMRNRGVVRSVGLVVAVLLGVVLPGLLLTLAYQAIGRLDDQLVVGADLNATAKSLPAPLQVFDSPNDYAFLLVAYLEAGNQRVMANKHRMKIAVMHIGFAVSCVGLLLMILGIDAGGIEIGGSAKDVASVNMKVASSGVAVFVLGALMAAAGGLVPNRYTTLGVPGFAHKGPSLSNEQLAAHVNQLSDLVAACEDGPASIDDFRSCTQHARAAVPKSGR